MGLALLDMCSSFAMSFSTAAGPGPNQNYPAYGNELTCTIQGFLVQVGLGTPIYNAAIGIFYILTIRFKWSVSDKGIIKKCYVPVAHFVILAYSFSTAIAALVLDVYGFAGATGCWIQAHQNKEWFAEWFALYHVLLSFAVITLSMSYLFFLVRSMEKKNQRWDFRNSIIEASRQPLSRRISISLSRMGSIHADPLSVSNRRGSIHTDPSSGENISSAEHGQEAPATPTARPPERTRNAMPLSRQTLESGIMYSLSAVIVFLPTGLLSMGMDYSTEVYSTILIINVIFLPLQGFLNMLIYTSPTWRPIVGQKISQVTSSMTARCSRGRSGTDNTSGNNIVSVGGGTRLNTSPELGELSASALFWPVSGELRVEETEEENDCEDYYNV